MRLSSFILYIVIGGIGIITTAIIADQHPSNPEPIYAVGLTITLVLFPLMILARRNWDRIRHGTKVTVNLQTYKPPGLCPETGRDATELRMAQYTMTEELRHYTGNFPYCCPPKPLLRSTSDYSEM
jgi:hypothetical protein